MSVTTKIEFDAENQIYYSGQLLKGRATLTIGEDKILRGIYIRIHGFGHCEWSHYSESSRTTTKIEGNETYIDERIYVVGNAEDNTNDICVAAGTYTYPFECALSTEFPSTLEMPCGSIKYYANLVLDRPSWQIPTPDFPFTVIKPLDLSTDFTIHEPLQKSMDQSFYYCCLLCCFESKPMTIAVGLQKTGFVPNEVIHMDVDVKNPSSEDVTCFLIYFMKTTEAFANDGNDKTENEEVVLVDQMVDGLLSGDDRKFKTEIIVPNTPPSDTTTSAILKISYKLRVIAVVGLCHDNVEHNIPIKIGTDVDRRSHLFNASGRGRLPIVTQPTAPPNESDASQPLLKKNLHTYSKAIEYVNNPPSYEEATTSTTLSKQN